MAIIELPEWAVPNGADMAVLDFGMMLRPSTGAEEQRIDRKGNRFRVQVSLPPMEPERARIVISRLIAAKTQGLRIDLPLLHSSQGGAGSPVVDGAGQAGTTLDIRGLQPGYVLHEGYWFSIEDENGRHYLHTARETLRVADDGLASIAIQTALRWPFLDGATIHLARPKLQGFVEGEEWGWNIPLDRLTEVQFAIREAA